MGKADCQSAHRNHRTICLPFSQEDYSACIKNPIDFRIYLDKQIELLPELFPVEIHKGYLMKDIYHSKKQSILIRRIEIAGIPYTIRPSFLMPYMTVGNLGDGESWGILGTGTLCSPVFPPVENIAYFFLYLAACIASINSA